VALCSRDRELLVRQALIPVLLLTNVSVAAYTSHAAVVLVLRICYKAESSEHHQARSINRVN